jgi:hypothetical protein
MRVWRACRVALEIAFCAGCTYSSLDWIVSGGSSGLQSSLLKANTKIAASSARVANVVAPPAQGEEAACYANLAEAGVSFERVPKDRAIGVGWPIELSGPVDGVRIFGGRKNAPTNYLDCRLALALLEWAPQLRNAGVVGLQHFSMYRQDAMVGESTNVSGHASGRAIDVGLFEMSDGRKLTVLDDWTNRKRGAEPCDVSSGAEAEKIMREVVCDASERQLFQMVLTPHYNDAHKNHVHLEVRPREGGSWIE